MNRTAFHKRLKSSGPVVLPVMHERGAVEAERNIRVLIGEGAAGVFLINHDFGIPAVLPQFLPVVRNRRLRRGARNFFLH